jgi:hypothetical protein
MSSHPTPLPHPKNKRIEGVCMVISLCRSIEKRSEWRWKCVYWVAKMGILCKREVFRAFGKFRSSNHIKISGPLPPPRRQGCGNTQKKRVGWAVLQTTRVVQEIKCQVAQKFAESLLLTFRYLRRFLIAFNERVKKCWKSQNHNKRSIILTLIGLNYRGVNGYSSLLELKIILT